MYKSTMKQVEHERSSLIIAQERSVFHLDKHFLSIAVLPTKVTIFSFFSCHYYY